MNVQALNSLYFAIWWSLLGCILILRSFGEVISFMHGGIPWVIFTLALAILKGIFITRKVASPVIERLKVLVASPMNYYAGWLSCLTRKQYILIFVMMGLGMGLSFLLQAMGLHEVVGLLRLFVGVALSIVSLPFWMFALSHPANQHNKT